MKKQLYLLSAILAFFACITNVNAQTGFSPAAGVSYTYVIDQAAMGAGYSGGGTYDWYVTQNLNIPDATPTGIIPNVNAFFTVNSTGTNSPYHLAAPTAGTKNQLNLTWTPAAVVSAAPFYLVLKYTEANTNASAPGCSSEEIRVWEIKPINTFLLAVENATSAGVTLAGANTCAPGILSAVIIARSGATPASVNVTYGESQLYYKITASGILGLWKPSIRVPALAGKGQNYIAVEWNDKADGTGSWHTFGITGTAAADGVSADPATITDATAGTAILVRLRIANVNYDHQSDQGITVGVDGYLPTTFAAPASDIVSTTDAAQEAEFGKKATSTILARPTTTPGATMPLFIQKLP